MDFRYSYIPNLFWGNGTTDKPIKAPNPATFTAYGTELKINWIEPYIGKVKLAVSSINYAYYNGKYYFVEPIKWYGNGLVLYKLISDFWINYWLKANTHLIGTLVTTNDRQLVLDNINKTVPLVDSGNTLKFINIEEDIDILPKPDLNFTLRNITPWHSYFDSNAVKNIYQPLLATASSKASAEGDVPREELCFPALLFTNHKLKWWVPHLKELAKRLTEQASTLKIYKPPTREHGIWPRITSNRVKKDRDLASFLWVGTENIFSEDAQIITTHKIKEIDLSTVEDIEYLGIEDGSKKDIPEVELGTLTDLPTPQITQSSIANYKLKPHYQKQTYKDQDKFYNLDSFKFGEIKDYNEKTINGEVKADGTLSILVGLKNLESIENWDVEVTQPTFLDRYGIYREIEVKRGDIIIPLSKYKLEREKGGGVLEEQEELPFKNSAIAIDLLKIGDLDYEEYHENKTKLFGDDWFELEALAIKPEYYNKGYTYGYLTIEELKLPTALEEIDRVYYAKIQAIPGSSKSFTQLNLNPHILKDYLRTRPYECELWKWYCEEFQFVGGEPYFIQNNDNILFTLPKNITLPRGSENWRKVRKNSPGIASKKAIDALLWYTTQTNRNIEEYSDFYSIQWSVNPEWALDKWLRDWDEPNNTSKWAPFTYIQKTDRGYSYTLLIRQYKGKSYFFLIPYRNGAYYKVPIELKFKYIHQAGYVRNYFQVADVGWTSDDDLSFTYTSKTNFFSNIGYLKSNKTKLKNWTYWEADVTSRNNAERMGPFSAISPFSGVYLASQPDRSIYSRIGDNWKKFFTYEKYSMVNENIWLINNNYISKIDNNQARIKARNYIWVHPYNTYSEDTGSFRGYGPEYITTKSEIAKNPPSINFAHFNFDRLSKRGITTKVKWIDFGASGYRDIIHYFDLKGTEWLLMIKQDSFGKRYYGLIAKDPSKVFDQLEATRYKLNPNLIIEDPIQIINQSNTLYFFGEAIPIKQRSAINNFFPIKHFKVSPLALGINSNYEYKYLELKTEVDDIKKSYSHLALTEEGTKLDGMLLDNLRFNHQQAELLSKNNSQLLEAERAAFNRTHSIKEWDYEWKYKGQGQKDWEDVRYYEFYKDIMGEAFSAVGAGASFFLTSGLSSLFSFLGLGKSVASLTSRAMGDPKWYAEERAREHEEKMRSKQLTADFETADRSYILRGERLNIEDNLRKHQERHEIMGAIASVKLTDVNDVHIHKALSKKIQLGDIYMSVSYPEGWLYDSLKDYYDRYGFDVNIPNILLTPQNMIDHINIKFSHIDEIIADDIIIRKYLSDMFMQGIRLRAA